MNNYIDYQNPLNIDLEQLDNNDSSFLMSSFPDLNELHDSIKMVGVMTPIVVQKTENNTFRILNGFKRVKIAKNLKLSFLTAFVVKEKTEFLDIFNIILSENLSIREFNIIEKALVIQSLQEKGLDQKIITKDYLTKLSLKYNPELFSWLKKILRLSEVIQQQLAKDTISYNVIDFIDQFSSKEQIQLINLLDNFKLGKNKQKEFINLVQDILRREEKAASTFLDDICSLDFYNSNITPSQKSEKLFKYLRIKRYPLYSEHEDAFNQWKNSLKLLSLKLEHAPFFESSTLKGSFSLKDKKILESIISDMKKIKNSSNDQWLAINHKKEEGTQIDAD